MFNLIRISTVQLIYHYFHIGFSKTTSNFLLKKYFLGFYNNITIINLNYTLFFLKLNFSILFTTLIKNGRLLLFSEEPDLFSKQMIRLYKFFKIYFCLQRWGSGYLTRFKTFLRFFTTNYFYMNSVPDIVFNLYFINYHATDNLSSELKRLVIPSINLIDSIHTFALGDYFTLANAKSIRTARCYLNFVNQIIFKAEIKKKLYFFKSMCRWIINKYILNCLNNTLDY